MKGRRAARDLAFHVLFEMDARLHRSLEDVLEQRVRAMEEERGDELDPAAVEFARALAQGAVAHRATLDERIHAAASAFPLEQMPSVERVCLELAVYDLEAAHSAPTSVIINEAVEMAKTYGGASSGRFVNGVLGTIAEELAAETAPPAHNIS